MWNIPFPLFLWLEPSEGKKYSYTGMEARCVNCGSLVYISEISDANLEALYHIFQEGNEIVQLSAMPLANQ